MKALSERIKAAASAMPAQQIVQTGSGLSSEEKKELFDAIEMLKSENQTLQSKLGESGEPKPKQQQQVFI